jgi:hypothetical protein
VIAEVLDAMTGKGLLTGKPARPQQVWYVNCEDPRDEIDRRIAAACIAYRLDQADVDAHLFTDTGRDRAWKIATYSAQKRVTIDTALVDGIIAEIKRRKLDVLIIDPLKRIHDVDENDNSAMDLVMQQLARIADEGNCAVVVVHHTRKTAGSEVTADTSRGAKSVTDAARVVRTINVMTDKEAERAGITDHRRYFRCFHDKVNLAPPPEASDWYRLESIALGNGPDGSAGDSVGVAMPWQWPDAFAGVTVATLRAVQHKIDGGTWREDPRATAWVGKAVAEVLGINPAGKSERGRIGELLKAWIKSGALKVIELPDEHRHNKPHVVVGEWAT